MRGVYNGSGVSLVQRRHWHKDTSACSVVEVQCNVLTFFVLNCLGSSCYQDSMWNYSGSIWKEFQVIELLTCISLRGLHHGVHLYTTQVTEYKVLLIFLFCFYFLFCILLFQHFSDTGWVCLISPYPWPKTFKAQTFHCFIAASHS